jgi:hypothetical protein
MVDQILIVEGAVSKMVELGYKESSEDGTYEAIERLLDKDYLNKIEIIQKDTPWDNKIEMQNSIAKRVRGEVYVKMDADEIWKPSTLMDVVSILLESDADFLRMPFHHFWTNFETVAKDNNGKWSTKHPRVWKWRTGMYHLKSFNFFVSDPKERLPVKEPFFDGIEYEGDGIYHMGWARSLKYTSQKLDYYAKRGIETYTVDNYSRWENMDDPTQCTQASKSWAEIFAGKLPKVLQKHKFINSQDIRLEKLS